MDIACLGKSHVKMKQRWCDVSTGQGRPEMPAAPRGARFSLPAADPACQHCDLDLSLQSWEGGFLGCKPWWWCCVSAAATGGDTGCTTPKGPPRRTCEHPWGPTAIPGPRWASRPGVNGVGRPKVVTTGLRKEFSSHAGRSCSGLQASVGHCIDWTPTRAAQLSPRLLPLTPTTL